MARTLLVLGSTLVGFALLEGAGHLAHGPSGLLHWPNRPQQRQAQYNKHVEGTSQFVRDSRLGYAPRPDYRSLQFNHDPLGHRLNGTAEPEDARPPLLAAGDSFTYGDDVTDSETWPAALQRALGRRVVNAGVNGYGLDQTVLRAEREVAAVRPALLIVGFIADDLDRSEFSHLWGAEKPFFELAADDTLIERNQPVPLAPGPRGGWSVWQRLLGWSIVIDTVLTRLDSSGAWAYGNVLAMPRGAAETALACPMMKRLARLGVPTLMVAQYEPAVWTDAGLRERERRRARLVLSCAGAAGLAVLDTFEPIERAVAAEGVTAFYPTRHHGGRGNELMAQAIAAELRRLGWTDR